jgi:carbonic anhydrase
MDLAGLEALPHVKEWLGYAKAAVAVVDELSPEASDEERMNLLLKQNVMLQLQHLKTHPSVAARLAKGDLCLHGWVYDIKTGGVEAYDDATNTFVPVDKRYAEEIAKLTSSSNCAA